MIFIQRPSDCKGQRYINTYPANKHRIRQGNKQIPQEITGVHFKTYQECEVADVEFYLNCINVGGVTGWFEKT